MSANDCFANGQPARFDHRQAEPATGSVLRHGSRGAVIPSGVSGEKLAGFGCAHSSKLRAERDKLAPRLKELAESGITVIEAAKQMSI